MIERHIITVDGIVDLLFIVVDQMSLVKWSIRCLTMWSLWKVIILSYEMKLIRLI